MEVAMRTVDIYKSFTDRKVVSDKKVSVIIPNYNYAAFLEERIDSIIHQTYPIYELIVLDDCSSDNSVSLIEKKCSELTNVKIKIIINQENSGSVFSQWQKGISQACGDYFWICEADDSAEPTFLETVMKGFDDPKVVLSYSDSARIDDKNQLIRSDCQDLYNMFGCDHWDHPFVVDGKEEIRKYLSVLNTILNVSGVVWKKTDDILQIIEEAKKYKVAGDWYIYVKLLMNGKLAFFNQSLNYYRKHEGSVTSTIKADIEYQEIIRIQEMAADQTNADMSVYRWQRLRRSFMDSPVSKEVKKKRIAWIIPFPGKGSGGHRTIIQNVNALIRHGYECDIYAESPKEIDDTTVARLIDEYYEVCAAKCYAGFFHREQYDLVFVTGWQTLNYVRYFGNAKKAYFIQDYEPCFFPMGDQYLTIESSYSRGYIPLTIGKWLSGKMQSEFHAPARYFDFCADLTVYHPEPNIEKENAICYVLQPEKPRRGTTIALQALQIVKEIKPDLTIYLYGSNVEVEIPFKAEKLGIIPISKCNELYNKCLLGLCISASNPSRIPFEMMAAGLPVVELYRENNLYDLPEKGVLLAESSPASIAAAILKLLDNPQKREQMSEFGPEYMKDYPLERGFSQFIQSVDMLFSNSYEYEEVEKVYKADPVICSDSLREKANEILDRIQDDPWNPKNDPNNSRKYKVIRFMKKVYHRLNRLVRK